MCSSFCHCDDFVLTIPVTVASAERSFSKLKPINNCLKSAMGQEGRSGLSIISIENRTARNINLEEIIKTLSEMKARKGGF
jgi:hypothetical protein